MDKLITILSDLYILLIGDTIPDYILEMITWISFWGMMLIICTPIIVVFIILAMFLRRRGGMYD
jgi:uncharacterized membrane protein